MQGHAEGDHCGAQPKPASCCKGPVFRKYSQKKGGEHFSTCGHGHHHSIFHSFSDRAHGVPFFKGENCARHGVRNQEKRRDMQFRTSGFSWRTGLNSMLNYPAGEGCFVLRMVTTAKSSPKSECTQQDHVLVSLVQTYHLL